MIRSSLDILTSTTGNMIAVHSKLREVIENSKSQDNPEKYIAFLSASVRGRWFNENYLSRRREIGMKGALMTLSKSVLKGDDNADYAARLELNMFKDISSSKQITSNSHFLNLEDSLPDVLRMLGRVFPGDKVRLTRLADRLEREIDRTQAFKERVLSGGREKKLADPNKELLGQQAASVEAIITSVLSTIDKRSAHVIRQLVGKSDNKLQTLEQELNKLVG